MILINFLIWVTLTQEEQQTIQVLQIGELHMGFISSQTQNYELYRLKIPSSNQANLIVTLEGYHPNSNPKIYISKTIKTPTNIENADVVACEIQENEICFINQQDIEESYSLNVAIVSQLPTMYFLRIDTSKTLRLELSGFLTFLIKQDNQVQIIEFQLGQLNQQQPIIEILIEASNKNELEECLDVYMNKKANGVPSKNKVDYEGKDTWNNQKIIKFQQNEPFEEFIIVIKAQQGTEIWISSNLQDKQQQLQPFIAVQSAIDQGDQMVYKASLSSLIGKTCDYSITFIPFQGSAKLYANLNFQPPFLDDYLWQGQDKQGFQIFISKEELLTKNVDILGFYIALYGQEFCSYSLNLQCLEINQDARLSPGIQHQRNINCQQIPSFRIYQLSNKTLIVDVKTFVGKVNFLVTDCNDVDCPKNLSLFDNYKELAKKFSKNFNLIQSEEQIFQFSLKCLYFCQWRIFSQLDKSSKFDIANFSISYHQIQNSVILQENTPHKDSVSKLEVKYYQFLISENDEIYQLSFLLTTIEGKATMYVSKNNPKPNEDDYEFKSKKSIYLTHDQTINSRIYYIAILGESECQFKIIIWILRTVEDYLKIGQFPWQFIQIYQGDSSEYKIQKDQVSLFKIDLSNYSAQYRRKILVNLIKLSNDVEIFGFNRPSSNEQNYLWRSSDQILLNENDQNYPDILYLRVKVIEPHDFAVFKIVYHHQYKTVQVFENQQYLNYMTTNELQNFIYYFKPGVNFIITKNIEYANQPLNQSMLQFQVNNKDYAVFKYSSDNFSVLIQPIINNSYFGHSGSSIFYFSLESKQGQFYSILIKNIEISEVQLIEDQSYTKNAPVLEDKFYFYAKFNDLYINTISYSARLYIYAKFIQENQEKVYPNKKYYDRIFKSHNLNHQNSLHLSKTDLEQYNCTVYCLVLLSVLARENYVSDYSSKEYTIQFNQNLGYLKEEQGQTGYVGKNSISYFSIYIPNQFNQQNLMVSLNSIESCNVDLYISKNVFPTIDYSDWSSQEDFGDIIVIEAGNKVDPNIAGQYYIGVAAMKDCQFSIKYQLGNFRMFDIQFNLPLYLDIQKEEIVYLILPSFEEKDLLSIFMESPSNLNKFYVDQLAQKEKGQVKTNFSQLLYNNYQQGYNGFLLISDVSETDIFYIAIKGNIDERIIIQANNHDSNISIDQGRIYNFYSKKNVRKVIIINSVAETVVLYIHPSQGALQVQYSLKNQTTSGLPNQSQLEIKQLTQNQFLIDKSDFLQLELVAEEEPTIFKIWYIDKDTVNPINILPIIPQNVRLTAQNQVSFIYSSENSDRSEEQINKTISIILFLHPSYQKVFAQHKVQQPELFAFSQESQSQIQPLIEIIDQDFIYKEYLDQESKYEITIKNNELIVQEYWLLVGTSDLRPLVPKMKQYGSITLDHSSYFFYSFPSEFNSERYLYYEMFLCNGIFSASKGSDLDKLQIGLNDSQIEDQQNELVKGYFHIDDQIFYLKLNINKLVSENMDSAQFTIRIYEVDSMDQIPYDKIYPGDQGFFSYQLEESEVEDKVNIVLSYAPLNYQKVEQENQDITVQKVEYFLLVQQGREETSFNYCVEPDQQIMLLQNEPSKFENVNIKSQMNYDKNSHDYILTILAKVHVTLPSNQNLILEYFYDYISIDKEDLHSIENNRTWRKFILISIIISLISVAALIIYCKIRMRKQKQFEYQDSQQ